MKQIGVVIDDQFTKITVERYFKFIDTKYLVYSSSGPDLDGNVRICVIKIDDDNSALAIENIEEWEIVKKLIIELVNDNKMGNPLPIEDKNYFELEGIIIKGEKPLRLPSAVMPYLSMNSKEFDVPISSLEEIEIALEKKVNSLKEMNENLTNLMDEVDEEIDKVEVEDPLEATMEIILPTKSMVFKDKEEKEPSKLKKIFNKIKEEVKEIDGENKEEIKKTEEDKFKLPEPISLAEVFEKNEFDKESVPSIPEANIEILELKKKEETTQPGFDILQEEKTNKKINKNVKKENNNSVGFKINDQEEDYKELYEMEKIRIKTLEETVEHLENELKSNKEILSKIKTIVE